MTTPTPKARPMTPSRLQWRLARGRLWTGPGTKPKPKAILGRGKGKGETIVELPPGPDVADIARLREEFERKNPVCIPREILEAPQTGVTASQVRAVADGGRG